MLEVLIKQFVERLRSHFVTLDQNSPQCARATVSLQTNFPSAADAFKQFIDEFDDVETCRSQCRIDQFLLEQYRSEVESYIRYAKQLSINANSRGFLRIANGLQEMIDRGATAFSCKRCEQIGDMVIALDIPGGMRLEHTDKSFDYLCPPINQSHYKHLSETQVIGGA